MAHAAVIDAELEHLLAGNPSAGDPLSEDLSLMISQLAEAFPEPTISGDIAEIHIAKIVETAAAESQPIAPEPRVPGRNRLGARLGAIFSPPATRIAAFGLVLTTSFSGMAYAGVLPDQLQRSTAALGRMVGIELPDPGIAKDDVGGRGEAERPPYMHPKDDGLGKRVIREDGATSSRSDDRLGNGDPSGEDEGQEGYGGGGDDSAESGGSSGDVEGAGSDSGSESDSRQSTPDDSGSNSGGGSGSSEGDSGSDADSDSGSDADSDSGFGPEGDSDSGSGPEGDSEDNSGFESDSDKDLGSDARTDSGSDAESGPGRNVLANG